MLGNLIYFIYYGTSKILNISEAESRLWCAIIFVYWCWYVLCASKFLFKNINRLNYSFLITCKTFDVIDWCMDAMSYTLILHKFLFQNPIHRSPNKSEILFLHFSQYRYVSCPILIFSWNVWNSVWYWLTNSYNKAS